MSCSVCGTEQDDQLEDQSDLQVQPSSPGEEAGVRRAALVGRLIAVVAPVALFVDAAAWLLLGPGALRTILGCFCSIVLMLSIGVGLAARATAPFLNEDVVYKAAWRVGTNGVAGLRWREVVLPGVAGPACVALLVGLGASAVDEPSDAQRIATAGARIVGVPVEKVDPLGATGPGRYDDKRAIYGVHLPKTSETTGSDRQRGVRVEVLSSDYLKPGDRLYVAYAPGRPDLEPVADEERSQVEQDLTGRALSFRVWVAILLVWLGGTFAYTYWLARNVPSARVSVRLGGAGTRVRSVQCHIHGYTESAPNPNSRAGLEIQSAAGKIPFELVGSSAKRAAAVLGGQDGSLEWGVDLPTEPVQEPTATAPADFVAVDGRRLQGVVSTRLLQTLLSQGVVQYVPSSHDGSGRAQQVRDLGASWPLILPRGTYLALLLALALLTPLYVVQYAGGWGIALIVASVAAAAAGGALHLVRRPTLSRTCQPCPENNARPQRHRGFRG